MTPLNSARPRKAAPVARARPLAHPRSHRPPAGGRPRYGRSWPLRGAGGCVMAWARIDDGFDDHPKVLALMEHDDGVAAIGLWILCLTWAHRNTRKKGKIPGRLPASLPRRYMGVPGRDAARLLADSGLWEAVADGWQIHDFDQYLPTAETSSARSEAGRRGAAAKWAGHRKSAGRDGKLPSPDGKPMASGMADDDSPMALAPPGNAQDATGEPSAIPDGTEPESDGKLPSACHADDGNAMASDGSRAPARRAIPNGIAPTPTPVPIPDLAPPARTVPSSLRNPR